MHSLSQELQGFDDPFVVVGIGLPGSGREEVLAQVAAELDIVRVNEDEVVTDVTGGVLSRAATDGELIEEALIRVVERLLQGESVIVDAPHTYHLDRQRANGVYRRYGATAIIGAVFEVSLEVAKERDWQRTDPLLPQIIEGMHRALTTQPPSLEDGFNHIVTFTHS
jgi:predicted kinase